MVPGSGGGIDLSYELLRPIRTLVVPPQKKMAVRLYPGGGLICQTVDWHEVMAPHVALRRLRYGLPACIDMAHLWAIRLFLKPIISTNRLLAQLTADEKE